MNVMKKSLLLIISIVLSYALSAQDNNNFSRKGKILIESGYGILGGYSNGSGVSIVAGNSTISAISTNLGTFVSENMALKLNLSILTGDAPSITNLMAGVKYYISGKAPVELRTGLLSLDSNDFFVSSLTFGYAAKLAPNIYLEPSAGVLLDIGNFGDNGSGNVTFNVSFAMII